MNHLIVKASFLVILAAGMLLSGAAGSAPAAQRAPIDSLPHAGGPHSFGAISDASPNDVSLNTQPCDSSNWCWVMRTNTVYAIYWMPAGSTCGAVSCASYENTVNRYFGDVAAASGANTNVYSDDTQYYDATGAIAYNSTFGGSYVDTSAFPASGCTDGSDAVCVGNQALEAEIQSAIAAKHWPDGKTSLFFILLPSGIGSCYGGTHCTTDPVNGWCAYHSGFMGANSSPILYAAEPFDGTITGCHGAVGQGFPNGTDADATINTISHEHNEAITDPWGNAWFNGNFEEIADLCAWTFGSPLGTTSNGEPYNQLINGHPYSLQQEYDNKGSDCVQRYGAAAAPTNSVRPAVSGTAAVGRVPRPRRAPGPEARRPTPTSGSVARRMGAAARPSAVQPEPPTRSHPLTPAPSSRPASRPRTPRQRRLRPPRPPRSSSESRACRALRTSPAGPASGSA